MPLLLLDWNALHPLIIHFPIALLLVAPLFVIVGALLPSSRGRSFLVTGFILVFLGSATLFLAVASGEAAARAVSQAPEVRLVLAEHERFAQTSQILFSALTLAFAALLFVPRYLRRELEPKLHSELLAVFLIFYLAGALLLVNAARQGTRLVHEFGITGPAVHAIQSAQKR